MGEWIHRRRRRFHLWVCFIVSPADFPHHKNSPARFSLTPCALTERFIHLRSLSVCTFALTKSENTSRVPTFGPRAFCPPAIDACNLYFGHRPRRRFKDWCANAEAHSALSLSSLLSVPWNNKTAGGAFCAGESRIHFQRSQIVALFTRSPREMSKQKRANNRRFSAAQVMWARPAPKRQQWKRSLNLNYRHAL